MNTAESLMENGIDRYTAESMLKDYIKRIGLMNGVYKITDITYEFSERTRTVELKYCDCGKVIYRSMKTGRNKWSELIKSCSCEKDRKAHEIEKFQKNKKDLIMSPMEALMTPKIAVGRPRKTI